MYLYHYSQEHYDVLKTRQAQGKKVEGEYFTEEYNRHISFFFDPIPLKEIAKLFKNKHPFWKSGEHLIEYRINVDKLERNIEYEVSESPEITHLRDTYPWIDDDQENFDEYIRLKLKILEEGHLKGRGLDELKKQIKRFRGLTLEFYRNAVRRPDFEENKTKYAAYVPHVKLYPTSGKISYEDAQSVVVESLGTLIPRHLLW